MPTELTARGIAIQINEREDPGEQPELHYRFINNDSTSWTLAKIKGITPEMGFGGQLVIETNAEAEAPGDTTIERLRIDQEGRVGIGTTQPQGQLHVNGNLVVQVDQGNFHIGRQFKTPLSLEAPSHINFLLARTDEAKRHMTLTVGSSGSGIHFSNDNFFFISADPFDDRFTTEAGNEVLRILSNGNVGIGVKSPGNKLQVQGGSAEFVTSKGSDPLIISRVHNGGQELQVGVGDSVATIHYINDEHINRVDFRMQNTDTETGEGRRKNDNIVMRIVGDNGGGKVGIGTTSPAHRLDVAGTAHATSFPVSSDARFKTNITKLTNVLEKLEGIQGVSFEWNELYGSLGRSTGHREIGLIAQEVETVFPEIVTTWGDKNYRAVDYGRLTGVLIEAIKELNAEIKRLKAAVATS